MRDYLMVAVVAAGIGTLLAPFIRRTAIRVGFMDRPDGQHKRHNQAVALGGGLLILISVIGGLAVIASLSSVVRMLLTRDAPLAVGFVVAASVLVVVGTIDDSRGMRGRHKLLGQILAALLLTSQGLEVRQIEILGWTIDLGVMSVPFTVFWLLGAINSFNLLDGIDGLAGLVALTTSLLIACVSMVSGNAFAALLSVAVAGGCFAFLQSNFPPARMFLGDTGSMLLGLMLGGLTISSCSSGPGLLSIAPAVGLLSMPILDAGVALLRRRLTGRSIFMTDRGHLHHCLIHALGSHYAVLLVTSTACLATGIGAVLSIYAKNDITTIACTTLVVAVLVAMRLFGHVECQLLLNKLAARAARILRSSYRHPQDRDARAVAVQLQGDRQWKLLWESLTEWGENINLLRIVLDINLPAMREGFHADWYRPSGRERHECWQMDFPLFVDGLAVGRLEVAGDHRDSHGTVGEAIESLVDLLEPFEKAFAAIAASPSPAASSCQTDLRALTSFAESGAFKNGSNRELFGPTSAADAAGLGLS